MKNKFEKEVLALIPRDLSWAMLALWEHRHSNGDWGRVEEVDKLRYDKAVENETGAIVSVFGIPETKKAICFRTNLDDEITTIFLIGSM